MTKKSVIYVLEIKYLFQLFELLGQTKETLVLLTQFENVNEGSILRKYQLNRSLYELYVKIGFGSQNKLNDNKNIFFKI